MPRDSLPVLRFASAQEWEAWLSSHHGLSPGVWLQIAKQGSGAQTVSYSDALDVAICHGWIDGQKGRFDDSLWLQRFTPRKPGSQWSKKNTERATALIESGRMGQAGLREVEAARQDGRWDAAYQPQSAATVPDDLAEALAADPLAAEFFASLDRLNRYAVLYRIGTAKRPQTRAKRIATFVAMLHNHEKIHR